MRAASATNGVESKSLVNKEQEEKFDEVIFPAKRVEDAATSVIFAIKDGIDRNSLPLLAKTTITIVSVFAEVKAMNEKQKKEVAIRVMHNVIDKEAKSKPNEFDAVVDSIKAAAGNAIDEVIKTSNNSYSSICCRSCVIL